MTRDGKLTKLDMARVIVQALYQLPTLPAADDKRVTQRTKLRKDDLEPFHKLGLKIIQDGLTKGTWPQTRDKSLAGLLPAPTHPLIRDADISDLLPILPND